MAWLAIFTKYSDTENKWRITQQSTFLTMIYVIVIRFAMRKEREERMFVVTWACHAYDVTQMLVCLFFISLHLHPLFNHHLHYICDLMAIQLMANIFRDVTIWFKINSVFLTFLLQTNVLNWKIYIWLCNFFWL